MSNHWNNGQFQSGLPSQGNTVKMFDPTQFQAPAAHEGTVTGKPRLHTRQQIKDTPATQQVPSLAVTHPSWSQQSGGTPETQHASPLAATQPSWSSWNTWDWNSESAGTQSSEQEQPQPNQQQPNQQQQQSGVGGTQCDNQYTNTWNQGWEGYSQFSQPNQAYVPSGTGVSYQSQELQQHQQQLQSSHWVPPLQNSGTYSQGQYEGSIYGQQHYASSPASQQSQQHSQQIQQNQQHNQQSQQHSQQSQQHSQQSQQHSQQCQQHSQQSQQENLQYQQTHSYHQRQQEAGDQSQVYQQGYEQYQTATNSGYIDPYSAGAWIPPGGGTQWGSDNRDQPSQFSNAKDTGLNAAIEQQHLYSLQNPISHSLPLSSNVQHSSSNMALPGSNLEVYTADDDGDGTVSGFFGKDDDGDIVDSQRHGVSYSLDSQGGGSLGVNYPLAEVQRISSEVGGAGLSTSSASDAGRIYSNSGKDGLLAQQAQCVQNTSLSSPLTGSTPLGKQYQVDASIHHGYDISAELIQRQPMEELKDAFHGAPNLPLNTNIRPASPDGDHPGSSGSGTSGGSSGLTDWEIVPPQGGSLNNSLGGSMVLDKKDANTSMPHSYNSAEHKVQPAQGSQVQHYLTPEAAVSSLQNWDSFRHPSVYDSSTTTAQIPTQPSQETSGHLRGGSIVTSSQQKGNNSLHPSQLSVHMQTATLVSGSSNAPLPSVLQPDGASNPFRRDGGTSPRYAGASQSVNSQNPLTNASIASRGPGEYKPNVDTNQNFDSQKSSDATTTVSAKTKLLSNSSTEDGNCVSKRDSDHAAYTTDINSTKITSFNTEDAPLVSQQQHHHSAFHPVGRQQQTVSPSASSLDNFEKPTPNILLAPVVPLIIPAMNPYSVSAVETSGHFTVTSSTASRASGQKQAKPEQDMEKQAQSRATDKSEERSRGQRDKERHPRSEEEEKNHSFDSLDEIDSVAGRHVKSYSSEKRDPKEASRVQKYERQSDQYRYNDDRHSGRTNPPNSQHNRDDRYYDRPSSRADRYSKDEDYRQHHGYYKDDSLDERYDRPRSRQDESFGSRPSSRSGQEAAVTRSRVAYDHDRGYYDRDRDRGYGNDSYSRNLDYYNEERERYYRYSKEKEARLARAYYEEYYGAKYAEYYKQLEQHHHYQQQQQVHEGRLSSQEFDRSSSHSQSRGSTPAVGPSPGPEQYGGHDSRPASRTEYSRDYYSKGYSYEGLNAYYDGYGYDPYAYAYGYPGYSEYDQAHYQGRMTPPKHSYPHVRACFGPSGQLVKVLPNRPKDGQPALVEVQDIQTVLENCPEVEELRLFPGPLSRNSTHKKDVLLFCQEKARACADNIDMVDRESAQLIWKFLELLIKQNGSAVGTDLSDLLLEGHEPLTNDYGLNGVRLSQSPHSLDTVPEGNSEDSISARESPAVRVTSDRVFINTVDSERENWVDRFRHLLLYGRKKDALECAMKNNLWGHALFLASKLDARTHANVMTRFANSAMRMNDPLQTLYQLMSGRQPAAVTCVLDERWGDWRPHLAMILSNQSSKNDIHRKSISTLGDTLAAKGYLYASHFCYLMAQVTFGSFFNKTSKIVLIGSSHNLSMEEFSSNEAIQCTEVYEYAQALGNPTYCLPHLQIYKYLYACRLADYGMVSEALAYCEVIANNILQNPAWFQAPFVGLVCQMSRKLQFADPQLQMTGDEAESQLWIQQLEQIYAAFEDGSIQSLSSAVTQAGLSGPTANSGEYAQTGYGGSEETAYASGVSAGIGDEQQLQRHGSGVSSTGQEVTGQLQNLNITDPSQLQRHQEIYSQHYGYSQHQDYSQHGYSHHQQEYGQQESSQLQQPHEYSLQQEYDYNHQQQQQQQYGSQLDHTSSAIPQTNQGYDGYAEEQHQLPQRAGVSTNELSEDDDDEVDGAGDDHELGGSAAGFDYFGNVGGQKVVAPPHRYRTTSGSSTGSIRRRRTMSGSSTGSVKAAPHIPPTQQQLASGKGTDKPGQHGNAGGGWFGGFFNKLKPKGKNEMILPDDKNPAIVWDPATKKWMNADGTEEVAAPQPPPPKDADLLGKPSAPVSTPLGAGMMTSSSSGSNKFSLKATGSRNQYVDISSPKTPSVPLNVFNAVPETSSVVAGVVQLHPPGPTMAPQMYSQESGHVSMGASQMHVHNTDIPDLASASTVVSSQPAPSMPVLFNPAALKSGTSTTSVPAGTSTARPGLKYGQRRAYPK